MDSFQKFSHTSEPVYIHDDFGAGKGHIYPNLIEAVTHHRDLAIGFANGDIRVYFGYGQEARYGSMFGHIYDLGVFYTVEGVAIPRGVVGAAVRGVADPYRAPWRWRYRGSKRRNRLWRGKQKWRVKSWAMDEDIGDEDRPCLKSRRHTRPHTMWFEYRWRKSDHSNANLSWKNYRKKQYREKK